MKIALFALFLLAIINSTAADFVVDTDGDYVRNGGKYHILSALGTGGGLDLARTGNETCPLTVVQSPFAFFDAASAIISSPYLIDSIYTGLILDIRFVAVIVCPTPTQAKWTVVEQLPQGWAVKAIGYEHTVEGWFKIEKHESYYKLVFCPLSDGSCGDLGIYVDDDGNRHLVVSKDPLVVAFKKAYSSAGEALAI